MIFVDTLNILLGTYDKNDLCAVCAGVLQEAYYEPKDSDGNGVISNGITYTLKRCTRCGLLYAKRKED